MRWTKEDILSLKNNYGNKSDKELSNYLKRSLKAISYMACKLKLKKDPFFFSRIRKKTKIDFDIVKLKNLYFNEGLSIRKIAKKLGVSKTTIEYYFNKYQISRRDSSLASKLRFIKEKTWTYGLTKEKDPRIARIAENIRKAFRRKRLERFKQIEDSYDKPINEIIDYLYWKENLTQEKIAKRLCINRSIIIDLMEEFHIKKRSNFEFISSLKGKHHSMYGKTWDKLFGSERASTLRKEYSTRSRAMIIKRLQNNEMPFLNTRIEQLLAKEMLKAKIAFQQQFAIDNKFVCDFAISDKKIVIECDGDYWHANPKIYNRNCLDIRQKKNLIRDKFKDEYLRREGWKVLRFFESDIKSSVDNCINQIQKQIRGIKNPLDNLNEKAG